MKLSSVSDLKTISVRPGPAEGQTTADYVAETLRQAILGGVLGDGVELNQVALADLFGVSRPPIREALRQLQAEDLVSSRPYHRVVVKGLAPDRVLEVFRVRTLLEVDLLARAAPRMDAEHLGRLRAICDEMDAIADMRQWLAKNREFHQALYVPAQAPFTADLVEHLAARVERYLKLRGSSEGIREIRRAGQEHRAILDGIEAGDHSGASQYLKLHLSRTRRRVLGCL